MYVCYFQANGYITANRRRQGEKEIAIRTIHKPCNIGGREDCKKQGLWSPPKKKPVPYR
jgi:hypothetical protein